MMTHNERNTASLYFGIAVFFDKVCRQRPQYLHFDDYSANARGRHIILRRNV